MLKTIIITRLNMHKHTVYIFYTFIYQTKSIYSLKKLLINLHFYFMTKYKFESNAKISFPPKCNVQLWEKNVHSDMLSNATKINLISCFIISSNKCGLMFIARAEYAEVSIHFTTAADMKSY